MTMEEMECLPYAGLLTWLLRRAGYVQIGSGWRRDPTRKTGVKRKRQLAAQARIERLGGLVTVQSLIRDNGLQVPRDLGMRPRQPKPQSTGSPKRGDWKRVEGVARDGSASEPSYTRFSRTAR